MNFALCFLAYGDEHITEFNNLQNYLQEYPTFVLTDNRSLISSTTSNIIETTEEFNFNLKRYAVNSAFQKYDTIVLLDTDIDIQTFEFIDEIEMDGMYVEWIDPKLTHKGIRLDTKNNKYLIELSKLNKHSLPIQFIPEYCVVIKISDVDKRKQFVERWGEIHNIVKDVEPTDRHYNLNGAIEGCIMYLTCMDLNIPIIPFGNKLKVTHYSSNYKFDKKLV